MSPQTCFHCGLPVTERDPPVLEIQGQTQAFCCTGCQAVCQAIIGAGHAAYYRYREAPGRHVDADLVPDVLRQAELYDRPDIQRGFVRTGGDWREASLILEEIRCAACLWLNEQHLRGLDGVLDVEVDYTSHRARVRWDPQRTRLSEILRAIAAIGYVAHPYDASHSEELNAARKRRSIERIVFAGAIGMPIMQFSITTYIMGQPDAAGQLPLWVILGRWTSLLATAVILAYSGQDFFAGAWRDLRRGRLGMDVPIVIGLIVAWFGGLYATASQSGEVYNDSIAMFVFLLLVARHVELRGRLIASASLDRMARVIPRTARRVVRDREEEVAVIDLRPGDRVRVRPGEVVPVDGEIVQGLSSFDESLLTGEPSPVPKQEGEPVMGGSINGDQAVLVQVLRPSDESTVSEIQRLVEHGLRTRPRYAALAERAAVVFVAVILAIAAATATLWWWLDPGQLVHNLVAVLIVTCPCALALATPVAVTLGAARLADLGVLPLRMSGLESLATARVLACDKTGTLTVGEPRLCLSEPLGPWSQAQVLRIAVALEQSSEHPFARAFRQGWQGAVDPVQGLRNHPGQGMEGTIEGRSWRLGRPEFATRGGHVEPALSRRIQALRGEGHSVIVLAEAGEGPVALFGLIDQPREGLEAFINGMRQAGVRRIVILSGDHPDNVARLALRFGIEEFHGGVSPAQKLDWMRGEQLAGRRVIMMGDGINDAPTLAAADASLSFGEAADAAKVSSDFLITGKGLDGLPAARVVARRTRRIVLQNLVWAAAYNLCAVPLAALGFVPPWGAAIGMSLSSLLVVGNSLRLRHRHREGSGPQRGADRAHPAPVVSG